MEVGYSFNAPKGNTALQLPGSIKNKIEGIKDTGQKKTVTERVNATWHLAGLSNDRENVTDYTQRISLSVKRSIDVENETLYPIYEEVHKRGDFFYVDRKVAEAILRKHPDIPYILRPAGPANEFCLSIISKDKLQDHYFFIKDNKYWSAKTFVTYNTVEELISSFTSESAGQTMYERAMNRKDFKNFDSNQAMAYFNNNPEVNYIIRPSSQTNFLTIQTRDGKNYRILFNEKTKKVETNAFGKSIKCDSMNELLVALKIYKTNKLEETNRSKVEQKLKHNLSLAQREQPPTVASFLDVGKEHFDMSPGELWDAIVDLEILTATLDKVMKASHNLSEKKLEGHAHLIEGLPAAGVAHVQGKRDSQEDKDAGGRINHEAFAGIFDGHGGDACANYVAQNLPQKLAEILPKYLNKYGDETVAIYNALEIAFVELHEDYIAQVGFSGGTTACVALAHNNELWLANAGDSRAVLCVGKRGIKLTEDAKADDESYQAGIEKRGGQIVPSFVSPGGKSRWIGDEGGAVAIETARQIGDARVSVKNDTGEFEHIESLGGNPRPIITRLSSSQVKKYIALAKENGDKAYLVLACDGIWDVTSPNGVASFLTQIKDKSLTEKADLLALKAVASGSADNCSAIVIDLEEFMTKE